jgi:hypothetical protein
MNKTQQKKKVCSFLKKRTKKLLPVGFRASVKTKRAVMRTQE